MKIQIYIRLRLMLLVCLLLFYFTGAASSIYTEDGEIQGIIKNENKAGIPGCTVQNKRTKVTTQSAADGRFSIAGAVGDTLVITHVYYNPATVVADDQLRIPEIILRGREKTEEEVIVNTGYQLLPRERSSGAFNIVSNKMLNEQVGPGILDRLRNVSNVYFDTKNVDGRKGRPISIRGLSTINGYADPLIVLDNFPYDGDLNDINPDDVESITILKDATAASIWGAKSANGVIVITTKKSKYSNPISIGLSSRVTVTGKPNLSAYRDMSVKDHIDVEQYLFKNNFQLGDTSAAIHPPFTPVYEMLLKRRAGQISAADSVTFLNDLLSVDPQRQYLDNFYEPALTQQYNLSLTGGGEKYAWMVSGSYNRVAGNLKLNGNEKKNLRIENRFRPFKNLELNMGIYYTQSKAESSPTPVYKSVLVGSKWVPYLRFKDNNGSPVAIDRLYRGVYTDTAGAGQLLNWKYYPLTDYQHQKTTMLNQNWLWQFGANYSFLRHFSAALLYQQEQQTSEQQKLSGVESFYTRDLINQFAQRGLKPDGSLSFNIPVGDIFSSVHTKTLVRNARGQISYSRSGRLFTTYALAGGELRDVKTFGGSNMTLYGYTADPLHYGAVNYNTPYPNFVTGAYSTIAGAPLLSGTSVNRFVSAYLNTAVTYRNRYTFNGSLRRDASNIFGLSTNDKWNPFWSTGVAWNLSKEAFYHIQWLSVLKLRASLGIGGNIDPSRTALPVSLVGTDPITNFSIRSISSLNNPSLRWEQSRQLNLALDLEAFNRRISGSVDFYFKKSENLFGPAALDYTTWGQTNTVVKNIASMKGHGVEISLQTQNVTTPVLWQTNFMLNYNASKVTDYFFQNSLGIGYFVQSGGRSIYPVVGKPLYSFAAYRWGGLDAKGDPQGYLGTELSTDYQKISSAKITDESSYLFIGTADPKVFGSVNNSFSYKSFFVSANISYRLGYYFRRPVLQYNQLYYTGVGNLEFESRWRQPGDEHTTSVPSMVYTSYPQFTNRDLFYQYAAVNVLHADNIRLEYINFGYTFQTGKTKRLPFRQFTTTVNIANLGIIWKRNKDGLDPDYPAMTPPPPQYTISISAGF